MQKKVTRYSISKRFYALDLSWEKEQLISSSAEKMEEYRVKQESLYMCFVNQEKAFDRSREVIEWAMKKKYQK